jgi:hypothetical protein
MWSNSLLRGSNSRASWAKPAQKLSADIGVSGSTSLSIKATNSGWTNRPERSEYSAVVLLGGMKLLQCDKYNYHTLGNAVMPSQLRKWVTR